MMELILQETIVGLGKLGDTVNVKPGYARNFLIPQGKAMVATAENIETLNQIRSQLEAKEAEKLAEANGRADAFREKVLKIEMHASEEGKLYGSVTPAEVVHAFAEMGHKLEKAEVLMPGSVRETGEHDVTLKFHPQVEVVVKLHVVAQSDESDSAEAE